MDDEKALSEVPSETVVKADTASHTDERGRLITVKRLNALQYWRLLKALGGSNEASFEMAMIVAQVIKINTTALPFPTKESDIEFAIQQLDFDGLNAAGVAIAKLRVAPEEEKEKAKN